MVTWDDFDRIWARTSPLTPYEFSEPNYSQGWNFVGSTPPARQMWDSIQKKNDEKFKYLRDNFGTPNIVTQASQMTDTEKVYVYIGSEAGWNSGHWYYYDEGTSSWADGGVYNSVAFVTDPTLSIAGQPADAKAVGDALALKADLAGCTFTGNVNVNADFSTTGDVSVGGDINATGDVSADNLTTSADATIGGNLSVTGTTALAGTSTAPTPSADDNSTKIATTEYVQTEIKPIETDVDIAEKDIANIKALLQGHLYNYQTDSTSAYTKTVPSGALSYASLNKVGGKTIVWNQLVDSGTTSVPTITGHVYCRFINYWQRITSSGSPISISDSDTDMVCDITLMFGAGNEPDEARFRSLFPANHYSYNPGTLLSAEVTQVISGIADGSNLLPTYSVDRSDAGLTLTANSDGSVTINGTATYSVEFTAGYNSWQWDGSTRCWLSGCPMGGGDNTYYLDVGYYSESEGEGWYSQKDYGNGVALQSRQGDIANKRVGFRIVVERGVVCNNLTFKPMLQYISTISTYSIPASIRNIEGYGWSAGTAYNYIDFERKKFVKCVDRVDLGSLAWNQSSSSGAVYYFSSTLKDVIKPTAATDIGNIVSQQYIAGTYNNAYYGAFNCISIGRTNASAPYRVAIYDSTKTDMTAEEFKASVSGVYAYYELATPVETDISQYLTDDNLISVESGGTLTFPNSNGTDYQIHVPSEEEYMIDLQSALGE